MNLLEKIKAKIKWLRTQPENVKVIYIWMFAIVIFAIVALLWLGLFRKYERKNTDDGKSTQLIIEEGKKIKEDIESRIKDIKLPELSPLVSPTALPEVKSEASPDISSKIKPEAL